MQLVPEKQTGGDVLFCLCPVSGDNGPDSEVPLHAFADPTEDVYTELLPKGGETLHQGQASSPLTQRFQSPTSPSHEEPALLGDLLVTPSSSREGFSSSEDPEKVSEAEVHQPAPEEDSQTDPPEAGVPPTAGTVGGSADAPTLETNESQSDSHVTESLVLEGAIPEDHSPGLEHATVTGTPGGEVGCGCVDKISSATTEGAGVHQTSRTRTTTAVPSSHSRSLDQDSVGVDTYEVSSVSDSGESGIRGPARPVGD